jgi:hypothetical protein
MIVIMNRKLCSSQSLNHTIMINDISAEEGSNATDDSAKN